MKRLFFLFLLVIFSSVLYGEEVKPQNLSEGDKTLSFKVYDLTGPNKGKSLCYV